MFAAEQRPLDGLRRLGLVDCVKSAQRILKQIKDI
jgi:hypothetical protein